MEVRRPPSQAVDRTMDPSGIEPFLPARVLLRAWCGAIMDSLVQAGIRDVVISPGSRNTPLTLLALETEQLRCESVVDERSAGFFALGMARATGAPVALLCTSGTAAAHYYPALIEASYDAIPLVVISADRPEELQDCGAPQTIRQRDLFGHFVRDTLPLPSPCDSVMTFVRMRTAVRSLVRRATDSRPGPVHLNVPLRKPLEPALPSTASQRHRVDALSYVFEARANETSPRAAPDLNAVVEARRQASRPLVVAGPVSPREAHLVAAIASSLQAPVLAEFLDPETAGLEFVGPLLKGDDAPDLLIHVGPPAVSSAWSRYLEKYSGRYFVFSGTEYREPSRRAEGTVVAPLQSVLAELRRSLEGSTRFSVTCRASFPSSPKAVGTIKDALTQGRASDRLNEPSSIRLVLACCSSDTNLVLGNSLSVRLASWVWPALSNPPHPFTARGVNGIDGTIAWAAGIATATSRRTVAILGDVTFAHDVGSLQLLTRRELPLVLVVIDNQGGRIFDHLPIKSELSDRDATYWTTPCPLDFASAAKAFGIAFSPVTHHEEIEAIVQAALESRRPTLVHLPTAPESTSRFLADVRRCFES